MRASTFTTYINAIEDKAAEAAFDRLGNKAVSTYATISRAAQQASAATAGLIGGRGSAGLGLQVNTALKTRATETRNIAAAQERAAIASGRYATQLGHESVAAKKASDSNNTLARSLRATATSLQVVQGPLGPLAGRVTAVANALEQLTGLRLGIAGVGAALFGLANQANKYTEIRSKLVPLFKSQEEVNRSLEDVAGIAKRARTSLEPVADLYSRLTLAGRDFGFSQQRVARLTELATKAATLSGGSGQSRNAGLSQFSQALGSGNLGGDELRSIKENTLVLAQSIAQGFKNADGSIGTTIGNLKELGSQGKLSSEQIADALERSSARIEQSYARLPKTLSTSSAQFGNQLLLSVGKFDQAIGFTHVLAEGLSLVADNLNRVIAVAAGIGTAFAIFKVVDYAKPAVAAVAAIGETRRRVAELDVAWQRDAAAARASATQVVAALEAEQLQIRENIALMERQRAVAARDVQRYQPDATSGYAGSSRLAAQAAAEEKKVVGELIREKQQLGIINNALVGANGRAAAAQNTLAFATENVTKRTGVFKSALNGILGIFGGPWGLALTAATTALYLFATAESNAERATRLHEDAQRQFASIIDVSTGKIYGQVTALEILAKKKAISESAAATGDNFQKARDNLASSVSGFGYNRRNPTEVAAAGELKRLGDSIRNGTTTYEKVSQRVAELSKQFPGLAKQLPAIGAAIDNARTAGRQFQVDRAGLRIGTAAQRDSDVALYTGRITTTEARSQKKKSVLDAEAAAAAKSGSTDPRQKAAGTRDTALLALNRERANGLGDDEYLQRRKDILATYDQEVQGIKAARKEQSAANAAARKDASAARAEAKAAERERVQTLKEEASARLESRQTTLEEQRPGLSTQAYLDTRLQILATYDAEFNAIDKTATKSDKAGAQRLSDERAVAAAIAESRKAYERQYQVQLLLLAGRQDEADALQQTLEKVDLVGDAFYTEYKRLLAQVKEQQKINDLLASRERIVGALTGVLDTARDGFEQLLVDLPQKGAAAGGDFLKSIDQSLRKAAARQITERLFAGADQKVRDLISGKSGVETQTEFLASKMNTAGEASQTLASSLTTAAASVEKASDAIAAVAARTLAPSATSASGQPSYLDPTGAIVVTAQSLKVGGLRGGNTDTGLKDLGPLTPNLSGLGLPGKPVTGANAAQRISVVRRLCRRVHRRARRQGVRRHTRPGA